MLSFSDLTMLILSSFDHASHLSQGGWIVYSVVLFRVVGKLEASSSHELSLSAGGKGFHLIVD